LAYYAVVPSSLLAAAKAAPSPVRHERTALRQWLLASRSGTPAAWQSVIDYFPEKKDLALRAEQQLALIYLREGDFDRAMTIFEKLSKLGGDKEELRVFGLAGKCGVLSIKGQYGESAELLSQFSPEQLTAEPMRSLVEHAIKRNRSKQGLQESPTQVSPAWEKWFEEQTRDNG
jgi:hypothetical protein